MKNKFKLITLFLIFTIFTSWSGSAFAQKGPKDKFDFPKLHKIRMPEVHEITLPNGIQLFLVEDRDFPTINLSARLRTGSVYEPAEKTGLASITSSVMRTGGSAKYPGDKLDTMLETMAANVGISIGNTSGSAYVSVLKEDIDAVLDVLHDILLHPVFPQDKIDLAKIEARSGISRRNDDIAQIGSREFSHLIFGKDNPLSREMEYATIENINRDDIVKFHKQYFHPNNMMIAIWGDFNWKAMKSKINKIFSDWKKHDLKIKPLPEVKYTFDSSINYVEKTDVNQAYIYMGHIGGLKSNPDYPALIVMNQILSFQRMFKRIRTNEGLAYTVSGNYGSGYLTPGTFTCVCQTKSESTVKAMKLMLKQIKIMQQELVTAEELSKAKNTYLNGFVFNFDSKSKILNRFLTYTFYKYPRDFNSQIKNGVEKVTREDVQRVAKKYLQPDKMRMLVVGNQANFDEPLSVFGTVNKIDITIPKPKAKAIPAAAEEDIAKAAELMQKTLLALGGSEKLSAVKNIKITSELSAMGMKIPSEGILVYPNTFWTQMELPNGKMTMAVSPKTSWMDVPGTGKIPMPAQQKTGIVENIKHDIINIFIYDQEKIVQYAGVQTIEEKKYEDILVISGDFRFHLLLNPESYLPEVITYKSGPADVTEFLLKYKDFNGIKIPTHTIIKSDGQISTQSNVSSVKINVNVDPKIFQ